MSTDKGDFSPDGRPRPGLSNLMLVVPPVLLYFFSNFFSRAIINQVLLSVICLNNGDSDCDSAKVSSDASLLALYSELVWNIPAVLLSGVYGQLLDRCGRKLIMTVAVSGYLIYFSTIFAIAVTSTRYYFELVVVSSFVAGCLGGFNSFTMAMYAYATDVSKPDERGLYFSVLDVTLNGAKVLAPYCSGLWAQNRGFAQPLGFASSLCVAAVVWVQVVLPETVLPSARRKALTIPLDPLKTFRNLLYVYRPKDRTSPSTTATTTPATTLFAKSAPFDLPVQISAYFLFFVGYMFDRAVFVLYEKKVFGLNSEAIGFLDSYQNLLIITSLLLLPAAVQLLGRLCGRREGLYFWTDHFYVLLGYAARVAYYALFSVVPQHHTPETMPTLLKVSVLLFFTGPAAPRSRSIATNCVPASEHSAVQASFSALQALSLLLSTLANLLYSLTVGRGDLVVAVWWCCAGLSGMALVLSSWHYWTYILFAPTPRETISDQEANIQEPLLIFVEDNN